MSKKSRSPSDEPEKRPPDDLDLIPQREAARYLRVTEDTLRAWRKRGCGPRFHRHGLKHARIFYLKSALVEWLDQRTYSSESEAAEAER